MTTKKKARPAAKRKPVAAKKKAEPALKKVKLTPKLDRTTAADEFEPANVQPGLVSRLASSVAQFMARIREGLEDIWAEANSMRLGHS